MATKARRPGRPRQYLNGLIQSAVAFPPDLLQRVEAEARRRDISRNRAVQIACTEWLEKREGKPL